MVPCIDPDALERYALGQMSESETAALDEHLLVCHACQDWLREAEDYARVMRAALKIVDSQPPG